MISDEERFCPSCLNCRMKVYNPLTKVPETLLIPIKEDETRPEKISFFMTQPYLCAKCGRVVLYRD